MGSLKKEPRSINWINAPDIEKRFRLIIARLGLNYNVDRIFCFRSFGAKTRAIARIWGLPRIWQIALKQSPAYVLEVIAEKFDSRSEKEQEEVLLHELAHIPKNFSGALIPHFRRGKRKFKDIIGTLRIGL